MKKRFKSLNKIDLRNRNGPWRDDESQREPDQEAAEVGGAIRDDERRVHAHRQDKDHGNRPAETGSGHQRDAVGASIDSTKKRTDDREYRGRGADRQNRLVRVKKLMQGLGQSIAEKSASEVDKSASPESEDADEPRRQRNNNQHVEANVKNIAVQEERGKEAPGLFKRYLRSRTKLLESSPKRLGVAAFHIPVEDARRPGLRDPASQLCRTGLRRAV